MIVPRQVDCYVSFHCVHCQWIQSYTCSLTVRYVVRPTCSRTNPVLLNLIQLGPRKISRLSIVQPPGGERFNSEVLRTNFSRVPVITANRSDSSSVNASVVTLVSTDRLFRLKRIGHTAHRMEAKAQAVGTCRRKHWLNVLTCWLANPHMIPPWLNVAHTWI